MPSIFRISGSRHRPLVLGVLIFILLVLMSFSRVGQLVENSYLDLLYTWRAPQSSSQLLVVGIDEPSFQELRQPWPWPRRLHADLIRRLHAAGARLIIFDVVFADPTNPEDDDAMAQAMRQAGNVILAEDLDIVKDPEFSREILVEPAKPLRQSALALGLAKVQPDPDGVVRHFQTQIRGRDTLAMAAVRPLRPGPQVPTGLTGLINYTGPTRSLETMSYYQVLDREHPLPGSRLRGRIVLVGRILGASPSPLARSDTFYTPFYSRGGQVSSGVELQGEIIHTLLSGQWGREVPAAGRLAFYLAALVLASYGLAWLPPFPSLAVLLGLALATLGLAAGLFFWVNLWMPPVLLAGGYGLVYSANLLDKYLVEARERRWLRQAFSRYLAPAIVDEIIVHPERLNLGGVEVEGTVLFADLAGFTSLSEDMAPQDLIQLLNDYFSPLTQIIQAHQGTLDKYIGDAILAFWGAPLPLSDHAVRACQAVLAMQAAMCDLQEVWRSQGLQPLRTRIGIHSGRLVAGNVGSRERFDYTILGDTVNLASRLEAVNKVYGTGVLLSEASWRLVADRFLLREIDLVQVYGRQQPVAIYELLGEMIASPPDWLEVFAQGLQAYRERLWGRAEDCFREVLRLKVDDPPAEVFLNRISYFSQQPPPSNWEGVYILESK